MEKKTYMHTEVYEITNEDLMDGEITGGGGSIVANPNQAKPFDPSFDLYYNQDFAQEDEAEESLQSYIDKARYNVWEE